DVDGAGGRVEEERRRGVAAVRDELAIAHAHGVEERAVAHEAAADEELDAAGGRLRLVGRGEEEAGAHGGRGGTARGEAGREKRRAARRRPAAARTRSRGELAMGRSTARRPDWRRRKPTSGWATARRMMASVTWPASVGSPFRNLRRAGTFHRRSRTSICVPA